MSFSATQKKRQRTSEGRVGGEGGKKQKEIEKKREDYVSPTKDCIKENISQTGHQSTIYGLGRKQQTINLDSFLPSRARLTIAKRIGYDFSF